VPKPADQAERLNAPTRKKRRFNWIVSDYLRRGLKRWMELSARLKGQRFYCRALSGESEYNLTINCDTTVSCSCQDYDGSGHLGDLNKSSFEEIYYGPVARSFREQLAKGRLPIMTCTRCGDLARVPKDNVKSMALPAQRGVDEREALRNQSGLLVAPADSKLLDATPHTFAGPVPRLPYRGMLLENTVRCNIDCLGCDRQSAARIRSSLQMDLGQLSKMADLTADLGLEQIFYLNLGEPFLSPNIGQELPLLRHKNPNCRIVISTNGIVLNNDVKREAALHASQILFSIAGIDDAMLKKYERYGNFDKAFNNLKALVKFRNDRGLTSPILEWKYLLFNWNDRRSYILRAIEMAREIGVDIISFWPTNNPFYGYSFRYRLGRLKDIGVSCWKGREVDLRKVFGVRPSSEAATSDPLKATQCS
jgi:pyruvate-formate lyase-activating enzyme